MVIAARLFLSYSLRLAKIHKCANDRVQIGLHLQNPASFSSLVFSKSIALSSSSQPLLSSFITLHIAGHVYTRDTPYNTAFYRLAFVYAMLVCTMELVWRSRSFYVPLKIKGSGMS